MKFLHTADWQIGMKAAALGDAGARVREERLSAGKRVIEAARQHHVDFVLVAGDLFEDNAVDRVLVQKAADILGSFGKPVFIIPGNHDPFVPGSVWDHPAWGSAANVRVLTKAEPVPLPQISMPQVPVPGGILFPCPILDKHSGSNPTAWIPADRTDAIRIAMAHGTVEGIHVEEPEYPIPRNAAESAFLDYLALGHWHSYATYPASDGTVRMAYSGTHETSKFGERDSGNALIVDIAAPGAPPIITPVQTGLLSWITIEKDIRERGDLAALRASLESLTNPDSHLVDARLSGLLAADERGEIDRLEEILNSRFLWAKLDVSRLCPSAEDESWICGLPPGIIRDAAVKLRDHPEAPPETAARALMELYAIAMEARR